MTNAPQPAAHAAAAATADVARATNGEMIEMLERRVLLAAAAGHASGLALARYTAPWAKLDSSLVSVSREYATYRAAGKAAKKFHSRIQSLPTAGSSVRIEAYTKSSPKTLARSITRLGGTNIRRFANGVSANVPLDKLNRLAALPQLWFAQPLWPAKTSAGSVLSQGDAAARADVARATYGLSGAGVKVGILSDSFDTSGNGSYADDVTSGDLPADVNVLEDDSLNSPTDEGRAMAQLIYDSAPGVSIDFATANVSQSDFADNIKAMRDDGAKVIVDDVTYPDEPFFQDGVVAQAVDDVAASGVAYFSAAGNFARDAYESEFREGNTLAAESIPSIGGDAPTFAGGISHDFDPGPGVDDMQSFTLNSGADIQLDFQWDQPFGSIPGSAACANEMDAYVLDSTGTIVGGSATNNLGNDPLEMFDFQNTSGSPQTYSLMLVWNDAAGGPEPGMVKYINFGSGSITDFATNTGASFGHSNAAGAAAVGAAAWYGTQAYNLASLQVESFSSAGGTTILFDDGGNPITPSIRQQPRFTAPDGGNTTFFGSDSLSDVDSQPNFFGTSAAAPQAAAIAALMIEAKPSLTPDQIYTILQNTALDMDDPATVGFDTGFDSATGYGLVRGDRAIGAVLRSEIAGQVFRDIHSDGVFNAGDSPIEGATVFVDANNNGVRDVAAPQEFSTGPVNTPIPDLATTTSTLNVSGVTDAIAHVEITLNIMHMYDSDLIAYLISPQGERVQLFRQVGGSSNNFSHTTLDDEASTPISSGTGPFTGSFRPEVPLSNFDGQDANGTWTLEITDYITPDSGTLHDWCLSITGGELATTTAASGNYTFSGLVADNYNLRQNAPAGYVQSTPGAGGGYNVTTVAGTTLTAGAFADFPITYATGEGDDAYVVSLIGGGTTVQILETPDSSPTTTYTVPHDALAGSTLTFDTGDGDDSLTIDDSGGDPVPAGGAIHFLAGDNNTAAPDGDRLTLIGASDAADSTSIDSASVTFNGSTIDYSGVESFSFDGRRGLDTLDINAAEAVVLLPATQQLQSLSLTGSGTKVVLEQGGERAIYTRSLTLDPTATLDLGDNDLLLDWTGSDPIGSFDGTAYTGITGLIQTARNGGGWDGAGGITTSAADGNYTTLAVGESSDVNGPGTHLWSGETIDDTTVIVKYTYGGDANLDGKLNIDDYIHIDNGISTGLTGWSNGDFNYDGKVNIDDYSQSIDSNLPIVGPPL